MAGPTCDVEKRPEASDVKETSMRDPWIARLEEGALGSAHGWVGEEELVVDFRGILVFGLRRGGERFLAPAHHFPDLYM